MAETHYNASRRPQLRPLAVGFLVATTLGVAGCPSPDVEGKFEDYVDQTQEIRDEAANVKMDVGGALADVTGTFHFALAAVIAAETPLQFVATTTFTPEGDGGTLMMELQPLSLNFGEVTVPREFVGEVVTLSFPVDGAGAFDADLGEVAVTGAANPITGSDIVATLGLTGAIQNEDLFCGIAAGMVTVPANIDLTGSTFAAVRIDATDPASLPVDVLGGCPAGGGGESESGSDTDVSGSDTEGDTATSG